MIAITGPNSMVGMALCEYLDRKNIDHFSIHHANYDLLSPDDTAGALQFAANAGCDQLVHLAGYNGNLQFNSKFPADIYHRTSMMALNVLNAAQRFGFKKSISLLASCAYAPSERLKEEEIYQGEPHRSVEAHGLSKRVILSYSRQLRKQFGFTNVCAVFNTIYGPHDSFDPTKTKVVGGLIRRFVDAEFSRAKNIEVWGSPDVRREFIYVEDVPPFVLDLLNTYDDVRYPMNVGSGRDDSICDLADCIKKNTGFEGKIDYALDGITPQQTKLLSTEKLIKFYGTSEILFTKLSCGIEKTVKWYKKNKVNDAMSAKTSMY